MKSLTVMQPWAWGILNGKLVENRTWTTKHRGTIAVHAGKAWDDDGEHSPLIRSAWRGAGNGGPVWSGHDHIARAAVVAVVDLAGICGNAFADPAPIRCGCGPWAARGQYHWRLANVRLLAEPVPCKGALGLWTLPDDVEAAVRAQFPQEWRWTDAEVASLDKGEAR